VLTAFREVVARPSQSAVRVQCDGKDAALGTVVAADGWVLTKASELKGKTTVKLKDGRELEARVVGVHPDFDLAMLKVEATGLTPAAWAESKTAPVGFWVASAGTGEEPVAVGVVSVAARKADSRSGPRMPPPNSGYLGIALETVAQGAKVSQVMPGTGAAKAGLKVNDVVVALAGRAIKDHDSLIKSIQNYKPGDKVTLKVKRGDEELEFKAELGKRPLDRGSFQNMMGSTLSTRRTGFPTFLQHDSVIKPNDCGGPLVDLDGKVIGINIARAGRTESYAVPAEAIQPLLNDLKSGKFAPPPAPAEEKK